MIYSESETAKIFSVDSLKAEAHNSPEVVLSWLTVITNTGEKIMIFMPYETALEYANAINGCSDRERIKEYENA
jgi:glucose-6-phosphate isomerase